jgi:hypothetical protein
VAAVAESWKRTELTVRDDVRSWRPARELVVKVPELRVFVARLCACTLFQDATAVEIVFVCMEDVVKEDVIRVPELTELTFTWEPFAVPACNVPVLSVLVCTVLPDTELVTTDPELVAVVLTTCAVIRPDAVIVFV